ncbi:putative non-specific serine/threonine protein kinase [Helianthus annuus]|nr:putative non-specific serine/threonine protein kinase [Helianthus annuus]
MKQFGGMNKLMKLALKVIAENLSAEEIQELRSMFRNIDTDNNGIIKYEELKTALAPWGSKLIEAEAKQLMEAADVDENGSIDYIEFVTATMPRHTFVRDGHLYKAFRHFDTDNSGYVNYVVHKFIGGGSTSDDLKHDINTKRKRFRLDSCIVVKSHRLLRPRPFSRRGEAVAR